MEKQSPLLNYFITFTIGQNYLSILVDVLYSAGSYRDIILSNQLYLIKKGRKKKKKRD